MAALVQVEEEPGRIHRGHHPIRELTPRKFVQPVMRMKTMIVLGLWSAGVQASEEEVSTESAIAALVADLGSEDEAKRVAAQKQLRARRHDALAEIVGPSGARQGTGQ